jgi:type I restriction enzyme S subunit
MSSRTYKVSETASFLRTSEAFGGFSNMHAGFPFKVGEIDIPSTENYYQAMRFPRIPDFQRRIISEPKPMLSKRMTYSRVKDSRKDWFDVNIALMRHSLRLKYGHHPDEIQELFKQADGKPIVEISSRDDFWGTFRKGEVLVGQNILGRLWMELRDEVKDHDPAEPFIVMAPDIPDLILCGFQVETFTPQRVMADQPSLLL